MLFIDWDWGAMNPDDPIGVIQLPLKDLVEQQNKTGGEF